LQERPYATAYWPFSVMESCTSNANPPSFEKFSDDLLLYLTCSNSYGGLAAD